ncbi:OmpA family protein [Bacteroides sp. 224]|uniref:OmpA family protein n=1 Tax=Bacteroides sp. 224 TaxID=2302936 RepID=UPI0013D6DB20|nr:OmpA family protein [Bacteroides sp. 224]NDV64745.1 OmpA family protein [Bacteroides sp. 224]
MKKILMLLAIAGLSSVAFAQSSSTGYDNVSGDKYEVFTNKFWDNWFISAGGGAEMMLGNSDVRASFKDRISPTFNVALGKWFTPGLGLRLQYSGFQGKGATTDPYNPFVDGAIKQPRSESPYYPQKFKYGNLHGDVMFNLSALLFGYNPDRVYEMIPYLGAGFTHTYDSPKGEAFTANAGIVNRFRISPVLDINLELSAMGAENKFDRELNGSRDFDGVVATTLGLTYRFRNREFKKPHPARQIISEAELRDIRSRVNSLAAENANLKQKLAVKPSTVVVEETVKVKAPDIAPRSVFFNIGSAKVSSQELINLGFLADQMQQYPELKFKVVGYADSATGSAETNKRLSNQRAQAVVDALVGTYKIERNRMTTDSVGGVEKYDKAYLNRMVQIEVVK